MAHLFAILQVTQPDAFRRLEITDVDNPKDINPLKFLSRLSSEIGSRGAIDVLRKGIDHGSVHLALFCGTPSEGNAKVAELHAKNRFSITASPAN